MEREAKEDWPKKAPGIVGLELSSFAPKTLGCVPKFSSLKELQWELWPASQTAQDLQKAKDSRTGSPFFATVTPAPTSRT